MEFTMCCWDGGRSLKGFCPLARYSGLIKRPLRIATLTSTYKSILEWPIHRVRERRGGQIRQEKRLAGWQRKSGVDCRMQRGCFGGEGKGVVGHSSPPPHLLPETIGLTNSQRPEGVIR